MMHFDLHTHRARYRVDPTQTITLRRRYLADMMRRFRELAHVIRVAIEERDVFGLQKRRGGSIFAQQSRWEEGLYPPGVKLRVNVEPPGRGAFDFPRSDEKVRAFMDWIQQQQQQGILERTYGSSRSISGATAWQDVYLQSAYQKGLSRAASEMRKAGAKVEQSWVDAAFHRPLHADRAGLIYTRAYQDLQGVTSQMDAALSRELAQGIVEGIGARQLTKRLVDKVGMAAKRAGVIARTETIRAHAEATLNGFEEAGVEGVEVEAEFSTSRDNAVCPKCEELEGRVFKLREARGLIPVHPNCRCAWIPIVTTPQGLVLR